MSQLRENLLEVDGLHVDFHTDDGLVHAVRGVSYQLARGETLGIVGESGSGKSVTHLALLDLLPPSARIRARELRMAGRNLLKLSPKERRKMRGRDIAMIFQDPMTCLNPFLTLGTQIAEMFKLHQGLRAAKLKEATIKALHDVGISKAEDRIEQYPHEFSGGMRQRAMIAMMLAARPDVLIADEPTTALDVTIQAQIMALLRKLQKDRGMSIVLITHDLGLIAGFAQRVLVMYAGRIVEEGPTEAIFKDPRHPYTIGLMDSVPRLDQDIDRLKQIPGQPPDLSRLGQGCPFQERCSFVEKRCGLEDPELKACGSEHRVACYVDIATAPLEPRA